MPDDTSDVLHGRRSSDTTVATGAGAFHYGPHANKSVQYITDAYKLLASALGSHAAKILFGVALLASGQNSTITGTLAGQVRVSIANAWHQSRRPTPCDRQSTTIRY